MFLRRQRPIETLPSSACARQLDAGIQGGHTQNVGGCGRSTATRHYSKSRAGSVNKGWDTRTRYERAMPTGDSSNSRRTEFQVKIGGIEETDEHPFGNIALSLSGGWQRVPPDSTWAPSPTWIGWTC